MVLMDSMPLEPTKHSLHTGTTRQHLPTSLLLLLLLLLPTNAINAASIIYYVGDVNAKGSFESVEQET